MRRRFCLACDLVDDATAIAAYDDWHAIGHVPPAIIASIVNADVVEMEIFRFGSRLVMILDVGADFAFDRKAAMDAADPAVAEWEARMRTVQRALPRAADGATWQPLASIFRLSDHKRDDGR